MKKLFFNIAVAFVPLLLIAGIVNAEEGQYKDKKTAIENLVNDACDLIKTRGQEGLNIIKDKNGKFHREDTYIFITSGETGADLVNSAFEIVEGVPVENYPDSEAKASQIAIVNAVKDKESAWLEYLWPKPGETKPSKKQTFLKKMIINGKTRIVGAGFYLD